MNYTQAHEKLGKRGSKKLGRNTYLHRHALGIDICVKLHGTDVLTFKPDGSVVYNTGGWRTNTTKDRMNSYGADGFYIWQDKGVWSLGRAKGPRKLYKDGIIITKRGRIIGGGTLRESKAALRLKKRVNDYCRAFALALVDGKVPAPGAGDCFYCHMVEVKSGNPLGDTTGNHKHIMSHVNESYFVPSLLQHAVTAQDAPISIMAKSCIGDIWAGKPIMGGLAGLVLGQVEKSLRKYIKQRLGMVV
jgi:hypothetical protein